MAENTTTEPPDGYDPKHKGKNVNHPRTPGSSARTGLTDAELKAKSNYGKTGNLRFRGHDVAWRIIVGGHGNDGQPLSSTKPTKHTLAIMAYDSTDPDRIGAAWHLYGRKISCPYEAVWLDLPPNERILKAVWNEFRMHAAEHQFPFDRVYLLRSYNEGAPIRVMASGATDDKELKLQVGARDEGLDDPTWGIWDISREEFLKEGRHDFWLRDPNPDKPGAVEFTYNRDAATSHPAVRASAIAYRAALYGFSYTKGLLLKQGR